LKAKGNAERSTEKKRVRIALDTSSIDGPDSDDEGNEAWSSRLRSKGRAAKPSHQRVIISEGESEAADISKGSAKQSSQTAVISDDESETGKISSKVSTNIPLKRRIGVGWAQNSCWLDSVLEALYQTLHPLLPSLPEAVPDDNSDPFVLGAVLRVLQERNALENLDSVTEKVFRERITASKKRLRHTLFEVLYVDSEDSSDDFIVRVIPRLDIFTYILDSALASGSNSQGRKAGL
jgi:hypothetical protein